MVASQLHGLLNTVLDFPVATCVNCYVLDSIVQLQNTKSNIFQVGLGGMYLNYGLIKEVMQGVVTLLCINFMS